MLWWTTGRMTECHREDQRSSGCGRVVPRLLRIQPPMSACAHAWVSACKMLRAAKAGWPWGLIWECKICAANIYPLFTLLHERLGVRKAQRASHLDDVGDQGFLALLVVCKLRLQGRQRVT